MWCETPTDSLSTIGVILAGGQARRMGGGDKMLRTIGGRPILAHVIERLAPQCRVLVLSANGDLQRFAAYGLPVVADDIPGFAGPLAGILAALDWVAAHHPNIQWTVSVAADTPFIPDDLVERLHRARTGSNPAAARSGGRSHPVNALWPVRLRDDLRRALMADGLHKVERFLARHDADYTEWPAMPYDPFFNINTPEDAGMAEQVYMRMAKVS